MVAYRGVSMLAAAKVIKIAEIRYLASVSQVC